MARKASLFLAGFLVTVLVIIARAGGAEAALQEGDQQCLACHSQVNANILEESMHKNLSCSNCHTNVGAIHSKADSTPLGEAIQSCSTCHADLARDYAQSAHGVLASQGKEPTCVTCHGSHNVLKTTNPNSPVFALNVVKTCTSCHSGLEATTYAQSFHGKANSLGSTSAATCVSCHGSHKILGSDNPASLVAKANIPATCANCHGAAVSNLAEGKEHVLPAPAGAGAPMYWTGKFFTWLTIITVVALILHIELELARKLKGSGETQPQTEKLR